VAASKPALTAILRPLPTTTAKPQLAVDSASRVLHANSTDQPISTPTFAAPGLQPPQPTIQHSQRQTLLPAKLATIQTTVLKLTHDLLNLGSRAPPLFCYTCLTCHGVHFTTGVER